jgi:hypothetical protein
LKKEISFSILQCEETFGGKQKKPWRYPIKHEIIDNVTVMP